MRSASARILIAIADAELRTAARRLFPEEAPGVVEASDVADVVWTISHAPLEMIVIATPWDGTQDGLSLVRMIRARPASPSIMLLVRDSSEALAIAALKAGVDDYFTPPWSWDDIGASARRLLVSSRGRARARRRSGGEDGAMRDGRRKLRHPGRNGLPRQGCPHRRQRSHHRRDGDGQGARRPARPRQQPAAGAGLRLRQLRRHPGLAVRERAVRP